MSIEIRAQTASELAFEIRPASPADGPDLALLAQELLAFYGLSSPYQRSYMAHAISNGAFQENSGIGVLAAADALGKVIGFLVYGQMFALANCRNSLFIQDIFVTRKARSAGVGQALMRRLFDIADTENVEQIDWTMDPWNDQAKRFYEKMGPLLKGDKVFYRLMGPKFLKNIK